MKEIMGGLWCAGLVCCAVLGVVPGLILLGLGAIAGSCIIIRELEQKQQAESWRKNYPTYKY